MSEIIIFFHLREAWEKKMLYPVMVDFLYVSLHFSGHD